MIRRRIIVTVGSLVALIGLVWLLQGLGTLPGSFMTGSQFWAAMGALMILVGVVVVALGLRGK
jgi:hypothetical protein